MCLIPHKTGVSVILYCEPSIRVQLKCIVLFLRSYLFVMINTRYKMLRLGRGAVDKQIPHGACCVKVIYYHLNNP